MNARSHAALAWGTLLFTATHLLAPQIATACSGPLCLRGAVLPSEGTLPSNMVVLLWRKPSDQGLSLANDAATLVQRTTTGDLPIAWSPVEVAPWLVKVVPDVPLAPGTMLVFSYDATCGETSERVETELTVSELALRPSSLGALVVEKRRGTIEEAGGSACKNRFDAVYADLRVDLASEARPYADVILYERIIDGDPRGNFQVPDATSMWGATPPAFGGSRLGRGIDRIYASCDPKAYAPTGWPGKHRVKLRGTLPDGTVIHSEEVEVDLRCDVAEKPAPSPSDVEPTTTVSDAGEEPERGGDERNDGDGGCAAARRRGEHGNGVLTLLAALIGPALRRRRVRRASP